MGLLSTMMSSLANIATVRSATPPTLPISSPNKKKNAKRPSPRIASLNTKKPPVKKPSNSATPLSSVKVKVNLKLEPFMNRNVQLLTTNDVEDDVVDCQEVIEEKCEPQTQGYTTELVCSKWPRTECTKTKVPVTKHTPETACTKVPRQITAPSGCELTPGPEECFDKKETVIVEVPEETCSLEPQKSCKFVTKLVPFLKPAEECVDIPKEVCSRSRQNPRPVQKPVVKKWCYVPSEESGLA